MRVIAGEAKGRSLKGLKGLSIRPTSDLVRGAIFSALDSLGVDWSRVLDLYAGTGALGIEALSRGAGEADFVDRDPKSCFVIKDNLERTGLARRAKVYCLGVRRALSILKGKYSLIFLDPPYADNSGFSILRELVSSGLVGEETTIIIEHSRRVKPEEVYGEFKKVKVLQHGDTNISIYRFIGGEI